MRNHLTYSSGVFCIFTSKEKVMNTPEIKEKLYKLIEDGDETFLKVFYEMAQAYVSRTEKDAMIAEGEEDIEADNVVSLDEARKILKG